jgi:hypothetical protein
MKIKVATSHCKGCVWKLRGYCPFDRCVKRRGFTSDKKKESQENAGA